MLVRGTAAKRRRKSQGSPKCEGCLRWRGFLQPTINQSASWFLVFWFSVFGLPKRLAGLLVKDSRFLDVVGERGLQNSVELIDARPRFPRSQRVSIIHSKLFQRHLTHISATCTHTQTSTLCRMRTRVSLGICILFIIIKKENKKPSTHARLACYVSSNQLPTLGPCPGPYPHAFQ